MPSIVKAAMLALSVALAGCTSLPVSSPLPNLDKRLTTGCGSAKAKVGEDARLTAKRKEIARRCEAGKRAALVGFYAGLQRNRAR